MPSDVVGIKAHEVAHIERAPERHFAGFGFYGLGLRRWPRTGQRQFWYMQIPKLFVNYVNIRSTKLGSKLIWRLK